MNTKSSEISSGLPKHIAEFKVALNGAKGDLDAWLECNDEAEVRQAIFGVLSDAEAIIAQKDAEIIEQCRLNGMGAEREAALLGKVAQQSAALKLAKDALESCDVGDCSTSYVVMPSFDAVAIDEALAAINEVLKGE